MSNRKGKKYESPTYEKEKIIERMSLQCVKSNSGHGGGSGPDCGPNPPGNSLRS